MARKEIHKRFVEYTHFIGKHPAYSGMPDLIKDDGEIQWEAPSNRGTGKFKDTHHKRRDWWKKKAIELGLDPKAPKWISRTAKTLHPTKEKPCGVCGRILRLEYAYPNVRLRNKIGKLPMIPSSEQIDPLDDLLTLIERLSSIYGDPFTESLPSLLKTCKITPPNLGRDVGAWVKWIDEVYIPCEPSTLSPGAMSNAPDRLDGFHTYNICCRQKSDKGRSKENLKSYVTDRRVFENWNRGDWIAADRLMGLIRSKLGTERCLNNHPGPCSADHIGPLSLGFCHRPEFQFLCTSCNSAKNNRLMFRDVQLLLEAEQRGEAVMTWYGESLWDKLKDRVHTEETALRLSKILRDNRHAAIEFLGELAALGHYCFLTTLLDLHYADYNVEFRNLGVGNHITKYDELIKESRTTKYALEQKARKVRIACESLRDYCSKATRNDFSVRSQSIEENWRELRAILEKSTESTREIDSLISAQMEAARGETEANLRFEDVVGRLLEHDDQCLVDAFESLCNLMDKVSEIFDSNWESERYRRDDWDEAAYDSSFSIET